jgi:hypothetical protein
MVHRVPGEAVLLRDLLRTIKLAELDVRISLSNAGGFVTAAHARQLSKRRGRKHWHTCHVLNASSDDYVLGATHDGLYGEMQRLLRGATLAVDGDSRNALGQSRGQHSVARDVHRLLADLTYTPQDDILDQGRVDISALDEGIQHCCSEIDWMHTSQSPLAATASGPHGSNDVSLCHDSLLRTNPPANGCDHQ